MTLLEAIETKQRLESDISSLIHKFHIDVDFCLSVESIDLELISRPTRDGGLHVTEKVIITAVFNEK